MIRISGYDIPGDYTTIKLGDEGTTEVMMQTLHRMDDNRVSCNIRNGLEPFLVRKTDILC